MMQVKIRWNSTDTPSPIQVSHTHPLTFKNARTNPLIYNRYPRHPSVTELFVARAYVTSLGIFVFNTTIYISLSLSCWFFNLEGLVQKTENPKL